MVADVLCVVDGDVGRVTLNRPAVMNAITVELARALETRCGSWRREVRVIVIRGAGGNFCAGGDFDEVQRLTADGEAGLAELFAAFAGACDAIGEVPVPVVAAVEGYAMAGGFELIQAVDVAIVREDAVLGDNHLRHGMVPGGGGSQRLPRIVGSQRALGHILCGDRISGREAVAWGLAYRAAPRRRVRGRARGARATACRARSGRARAGQAARPRRAGATARRWVGARASGGRRAHRRAERTVALTDRMRDTPACMDAAAGTKFVAVTGATGSIGRGVARRIATRVPTRLIARDASRAGGVPGAEVRVAGDHASAEQMRVALEDVETLLLLGGFGARDMARNHRRAVDAALAAGVERIVYVSSVAARPDAVFTVAQQQWEVEEYIRAHDVPFVFLRENVYMDLLIDMVDEEQAFRGPAGDGRIAAVARQDVADVAAAVLLGGGEDGVTYEITGPEALTLEQVAEQLDAATGEGIAYREQTVDEFVTGRVEWGDSEVSIARSVSLHGAVWAGDFAAVSDTVDRLTDHPPLSLADFLVVEPFGR